MAGKDKEETGGILRFLYNPDTKEVFGRTGVSWFKITVFYIIFYACLTAFWTVMLVVFYQTLDAFKPKWTLDASLIGTVPGLGFRPRPPMSNIDSTLIYFKAGQGGNWKQWVDDLDVFTQGYQRTKEDGEHLVTCSKDGEHAGPNKACRFPYERIQSNCTKANEFGYQYGQPCVLIKLNKIYGWTPAPFSRNSFPEKVPESVRQSYEESNVYITCEGENAADQENLGPVKYYPNNFIEGYFFPFSNVPGYLPPFIMVQFLRPERGVLINVECKAWAANILHERQDRIGLVHFELMID